MERLAKLHDRKDQFRIVIYAKEAFPNNSRFDDAFSTKLYEALRDNIDISDQVEELHQAQPHQ